MVKLKNEGYDLRGEWDGKELANGAVYPSINQRIKVFMNPIQGRDIKFLPFMPHIFYRHNKLWYFMIML